MRATLPWTNRVLICGDRHWNNEAIIRREMEKLGEGTVIIHGACAGADSLAGIEAKRRGFHVETYPADWGKHGKTAGPIRNQQMIDEGNPYQLIAFHGDLQHSRGTKDMVNRARRAGIPVRVVWE